MSGESPLGLPGIVLQEVLSGVRLGSQFAELERRLMAGFTILVPSARDYVEAARLRNQCLAKGLSASGPDCLIAVQAILGGHELLTVDRDFEAIAEHSALKLFRLGGEDGGHHEPALRAAVGAHVRAAPTALPPIA